jgi:hypothetical protein
MNKPEPAHKPFDTAAADELLGNPVAVDDAVLARAIDESTCSALAFELYKEATTVIVVAAHLAGTTDGVLPRNQAICVGLLVRIGKFMAAVMQLSAEDNRREVVLSLNRSILESAVNLRFLLTKNSADMFDAFVKATLGPERELYDVIQNNISARDGKRLPIEERMLGSIERVVRLSGMTIDKVSPKRQEWGGSLRDRLKAIGEETYYLFVQRIPSHAVHGSWVDLLLHHLDEKEDGFVPDSEWKGVDARLFNPIALLVLKAAGQYLKQSYGDAPQTEALRARIVDLGKRISRADAAHEQWMQNRTAEPAKDT